MEKSVLPTLYRETKNLTLAAAKLNRQLRTETLEVLSDQQKKMLEELLDDPLSMSVSRGPIAWGYSFQVLMLFPDRADEWAALYREYAELHRESQNLSKGISSNDDATMFRDVVYQEIDERLRATLGKDDLAKLQKRELRRALNGRGVVELTANKRLRELVPQIDALAISKPQAKQIGAVAEESAKAANELQKRSVSLQKVAVATANHELLSALDSRQRKLVLQALGASSDDLLSSFRLVATFPGEAWLHRIEN
jgi:hypothetical protein